MSGYHQFCGLARSLELVGDRWGLLIVRELLIADRRHSEIRAALPGVASNLLAERLRQLARNGVIERRAEPGRKAVVYALTAHGRQLRDPVLGLVAWGATTMAAGPRPGDAVRPHWVLLAVEALLAGRRHPRPGVVAIEADDLAATLTVTDDGSVSLAAGGSPDADARLSAPAALVLGVISGAVPLDVARTRGATVDDPSALLASLLTAP